MMVCIRTEMVIMQSSYKILHKCDMGYERSSNISSRLLGYIEFHPLPSGGVEHLQRTSPVAHAAMTSLQRNKLSRRRNNVLCY